MSTTVQKSSYTCAKFVLFPFEDLCLPDRVEVTAVHDIVAAICSRSGSTPAGTCARTDQISHRMTLSSPHAQAHTHAPTPHRPMYPRTFFFFPPTPPPTPFISPAASIAGR